MAESMDTGGHAGTGRTDCLVRVGILRSRLASLLAEWEDLRTQVIPHLAAEYAAKIGVWEQREVTEELLTLRARRKVSLLRAQISQGKLLDEAECERILDEEFRQWKKQMARWMQRIRAAFTYRASAIPLSAKDSAEFRRLFRTLARRLHPDLHPLDEERSRYYEMACSYYEQGDLEGLRAVEAATAHLRDDANLENLSDEDLGHEAELLEERIRGVHARIDELKGRPPYTLREQLGDAAWVDSRTAVLRERIDAWRWRRQEYERTCRSILKEER